MKIDLNQPAMRESLCDLDVYCVYCSMRDALDLFADDLTIARKRFFENGKKTVKVNHPHLYMGIAGKTKGKITPKQTKWKKYSGKTLIQESFDTGLGIMVRDCNFDQVVTRKTYFDYKQHWMKTEYFDPDDALNPTVVLRPRKDDHILERLDRDAQRKGYTVSALTPTPYLFETAEQSLLNAKFGVPQVIILTSNGAFSYSPDKETQLRHKALREIMDGTILLMPAWEVRDGEIARESMDNAAHPSIAFSSLHEYAKLLPPMDLEPFQEDELEIQYTPIYSPDYSEEQNDQISVHANAIESVNETFETRQTDELSSANITLKTTSDPSDELPVFTDKLALETSIDDQMTVDPRYMQPAEPAYSSAKPLEREKDNAEINPTECHTDDIKNDSESAQRNFSPNKEPAYGKKSADASQRPPAYQKNLDPQDERFFDESEKERAESEAIIQAAVKRFARNVSAPPEQRLSPATIDAAMSALTKEQMDSETAEIIRAASQSAKAAARELPDLPNHSAASGRYHERTAQSNGITAYEGEYLDGKRDGFGAYYYKDGHLCYAGFWKDDKRDGLGVSFRKSDHALHVSNWKQNKPGQFTALFDKNGNLKFGGRIVKGKKQGVGISYQDEDGGAFVGKWSDNAQTGRGTKFDKDGNLLYTGEWFEGKRHGIGISFDQNGDIIFSGEWRDDKQYSGILYKKEEQ